MATCRITWLAVLVVVLLPASRADAAWTATQEADCQVEIPDTQPHLRVTWDGGCRQGKVEGRGMLSFSNGGRSPSIVASASCCATSAPI